MIRVWGARHLSSLLLAYFVVACATPLLYASLQIGLEYFLPTPSANRGTPPAATDAIPTGSAMPVEASGVTACDRLRDPQGKIACLTNEIAMSRGALVDLEKQSEKEGNKRPPDTIAESELIGEENFRDFRLAMFAAILSSFATVAVMKIVGKLTRKQSDISPPIDG